MPMVKQSFGAAGELGEPVDVVLDDDGAERAAREMRATMRWWWGWYQHVDERWSLGKT